MQAPTTDANLEVDGLTTFRSHPDTTFRFVLKVKDKKINIWLEDRKSKKQWESDFLALDEFVTTNNTIPDATLEQYVWCFKTALEAPLETTTVSRKLFASEGDKMRLEFVGQFELFGFMWSPTYTFTLTPIVVGRIDIVESKIFDLEEAVHGKRSEPRMVSEFEVAEAVPFDTETWGHCKWKPTAIGESETFSVHDGKWIRAHVAGTYLIGLQFKYVTRHNQAMIGLTMGDQDEVSMRTALHNSNGVLTTTYHQWIIFMKKDDEVTINFDELTLDLKTKMSITRLGN